ncbi:MAG: adenylyltransferase/cytidyltransferase family protein [Candidatus Woesearchaeota archaeon]|jgi:FAD synthetase|nr:adenylyltransferase/cytidyltransferase family protein [Candidatus Woesearchaeota archaeon]MDP7506643.1 adenylyltransferase/cytidyltransferase family protein [Candidatus Woesearchaeota archaeon]MDP7610177.1 adenylyltransferase/cytidyltransferase family protein [Candidatus Woesearchaeota archaeon]|tara:strand:- start:428 stop:823 length:396 start_codon:yes stop_codon:yes gene_type:complete
MQKVLIFGTYDIIHPGHLNFFNQARKHGKLTIIISRDKTVKQVKGKLPLNNETKRLANLKSLNITENIFLGNLKDKYGIIKQLKPDVICLGYDQEHFIDKLKQKIKEFNLTTKLIRLKPYKEKKYKSSKLK